MWGAVVKNPPANAGDTGWSPGPGKIPHAAEQLSPRVTLLSLRSRGHEPQLLNPTRLEPMLRNKRSHRIEKPVHCNEE